jgi:hypothetical protein
VVVVVVVMMDGRSEASRKAIGDLQMSGSCPIHVHILDYCARLRDYFHTILYKLCFLYNVVVFLMLEGTDSWAFALSS